MDPAVVVSGFPGIEEFPGIADAWHWSPAPGLDFAAVLSEDRRHLFQVNARDSYDEALVRALLVAACKNGSRLLSGDALLTTIPGFRNPGHDFDVLAAARPEVHRFHEVQEPELQKVTWAVFPGYGCEFARPDRYTLEDARESFNRFLTPANLDRAPAPFLSVRYYNTVTKGGTGRQGSILVKPEILYHELKLLEGAPGSFVEFENFRGQVFRVEWDLDWILSEGAGGEVRRMRLDDLLAFAAKSLHV
ncbi:hypothetical protein [Streptomyces sp. NBC_01236]|uniref:hypothetical protein n=1 Tax=Streptomyces sp. NBC_01236 TaxID=2903789 RepID=UPI002E13A6EE|nr:hypothetical protein OG324_28685 [Streptomyces sp. NBC_01236]